MLCLSIAVGAHAVGFAQIGAERAIDRHLAEGEELRLSLRELLEHGKRLFVANWTIQEGGGRPLTKGTGAPLSDPSSPLTFPRNFNRVSAPDANTCAGCHNAPFGIPGGGGGDVVANVFVLGQRFDFATMNMVPDGFLTKGTTDEGGVPVALDDIADARATLGMFGSGYIEMLARRITADLQAIRDGLPVGVSAPLVSKGLSFGVLSRTATASWDTTRVTGLSAPSLAGDPPSLIVRPFHQAGAVVSLRQFTTNAMNHHGIQATERFGTGDPDGDGFEQELSGGRDGHHALPGDDGRARPGHSERSRRGAGDPARRAALSRYRLRHLSRAAPAARPEGVGVRRTQRVQPGREPPAGRRPGRRRRPHQPAPALSAAATRGQRRLGTGIHRLQAARHLRRPGRPNIEPIDMHAAAGSPEFFAGNRRFLTRKLWGVANEPPYFHHGKFTTLREAVRNHGGEASWSRAAFLALPPAQRDAVIEFLKSLQVLPPGTPTLVVDERGRPRRWSALF